MNDTDTAGQRIGLQPSPHPQLHPLTLHDKPQFDRVFARLAQPISDYSFANTLIWGAALKLYRAVLHEHLCVFANGSGDLTLLMPPLPLNGRADTPADDAHLRGALHEAFTIMDAYNAAHADPTHSRIEYVSDEMLERIRRVTDETLCLSATPMGGDYVYDTGRMIDLAGGGLKSRRHARSRFCRDYPDHTFADLTPDDVAECCDLLDRWSAHGDATHEGETTVETDLGTDVLRHKETQAARAALHHFQPLGLTGMVLRVAGRIVGFTLAEPISPAQVSILVEKTDPDCHGAPAMIFSAFCQRYWADYPFINAGDDWGIPSLRFTKQSYRPVRMLSKFTLTRQPAVVTAADMGFSPDQLVPKSNPAPATDVSTPAAPTVEEHSPMTPEIRPAVETDLPRLLTLEARCFSDPEQRFNRRQFRDLIRNPRACVMVLDQAGAAVGYSIGLIRRHRTGCSGRLYALAVDPAHRGHGFGRHLAERVLQSLDEAGVPRVYLEVRYDNHRAIALYERLGFTIHAHLPNYYGHALDAYRMHRPTNPTAPSSHPRREDHARTTNGPTPSPR